MLSCIQYVINPMLSCSVAQLCLTLCNPVNGSMLGFPVLLYLEAMYLVTQLCLTLWNPMDYSPPGSSVYGDSPGKNTGVGCHPFLQGIFLTQELNQGLLHCRQIVYWLSHQESPKEWLLELKRREPKAEKHLECFKVCTLRASTASPRQPLRKGFGKKYPDLTSLLPTFYWCSPLAKLHLKPESKEIYQCCP